MSKKQNVIGVIPARYGSSRFRGKVLAEIAGKPMIQWVYEQASKSQLLYQLIIAVDDERVLKCVEEFGGKAVMTEMDHQSGTDRIAEAVKKLDTDIVVNIQGDQPLLDPKMIDEAVQPLLEDSTLQMATLKIKIGEEDYLDPTVVKVVADENDFALYFSRSLIPYPRNKVAVNVYEHVGLYVYRKDFLLKISEMPQSYLEKIEMLEQLRVLEKGYKIKVVAGAGADERTMLGAAKKKNIPCLVTVPQLIGGGMVGIALADSISIMERTSRIAEMMSSADVIIESVVALTQEIHDGPFETYTGHGIWSNWEGYPTYSLEGKTLIRINLDPNLKKACDFEKESSTVQRAIDKGMPKTKLMSIPFRMEMSGFARLEKSIPIVGDIGIIWPIMAYFIEQKLGIKLDFMSYPQQSPEGQEMRKWIVKNILPIVKENLFF